MATIRRLSADDGALADATFALIAEVFEDEYESRGDSLPSLLADDRFWAFAVLDGDEVIGGLTAHVVPMTRDATDELFIYDVAVRAEHQRLGVGRRLLAHLRAQAAQAGITDMFVPADNDDTHALDFYRALGGAASPVTIFTFAG